MGVGHLAVGLALKRAEPRLNAGLWVFGAFLCDFLLGVFSWLGLERAEGLAEYPLRHYLTFTFPYSHGLLSTVVWAAAASAVVAMGTKSRKVAIIMACAVLSHFPLDALVHVRGLPLAGRGSAEFGLGLWTHLGWALALEAFMLLIALAIYTGAVRAPNYGMLAFGAIAGVFLIAGQAIGSAPPAQAALRTSWLAAPVVFATFAWWLDRSA